MKITLLKASTKLSSISADIPGNTLPALIELLATEEMNGSTKEAHDKFKRVFGFKLRPEASVDIVGVDDYSGEALAVLDKTGNTVLMRMNHPYASNVILSKIPPAEQKPRNNKYYLVYKDSFKTDGPFSGAPDPKKGTVRVIQSFSEAKNYFADLIKS